jgi:hypothetical protein
MPRIENRLDSCGWTWNTIGYARFTMHFRSNTQLERKKKKRERKKREKKEKSDKKDNA